jgi:hypothetical protein
MISKKSQTSDTARRTAFDGAWAIKPLMREMGHTVNRRIAANDVGGFVNSLEVER